MCVFLALSSCSLHSLLCRSSARVTLITCGSPVIKRARISIVLHPPLSPLPARNISETRRPRVSYIISARSSRISANISRLTTIYQYRYLNDSIIKQERTSTAWILEHLFLARIRYMLCTMSSGHEAVKRHPYPRVYALLKKTLPLPRFSVQSGSAFSMCANFFLSESAPQIRSSPIYCSCLESI
ncbi:uncharacterized protein EDB91DRAFT_1158203 [Suillus paluster]|uniref:uncharacterized protein n=1 Tax=Suillus paluster TaxID=48578 RepID=UPI001B87492E|nr:uncharacterized protein EDB91DRAFT_1158203 [Suillus paluster]KAG1729949.1 hypothetical protein EDB91DRAFT_1158203 [Suillus paluster]